MSRTVGHTASLRRRAAFAVLRASGLPLLLRHTVQRKRLTVLLFHQQEAGRFSRTLHTLARRYSIIDLDAALRAIESGAFEALPPRPLLITLDDGRASNAALVPLLRAARVRPVVFIATGVVTTNRGFWWSELSAEELTHAQALPESERAPYLRSLGHDPLAEHPERQALSRDELEALATVADIEPHTRTHPVLTRCTEAEARAEIAGSIEDVRELLGTQARAFAYPNGEVDKTVARVVAQCGIRHAFTTESGYVDGRSDPLRLQRIFVRDTADQSELVVFASGLHGLLQRMLRPRK